MKKGREGKEQEYREDLAEFVTKEYELRREARRGFETQWLINLNFMLGNQRVYATPGGEIVAAQPRYLWQREECYNHIAPLIETRLSKFARVNSTVSVRPASGSDHDVKVAKLAAKLIETTRSDNDFVTIQSRVNYDSEVYGTAFYKIVWEEKGEGGVKIEGVPPQEIYPSALSAPSLDDQLSLIHARAYPVSLIRERYGVEVAPEPINASRLTSDGRAERVFGAPLEGFATVLEYYELPSADYPDGRLLVVASRELLYAGPLPYLNAKEGGRGFPFVKQVAFHNPASFFGKSLIERLIPIQRAYNAVKNRKHELMNRLSAGVTAVEEGSVDVERLEEEGLSPGSVLVYRQGSTPPMPLAAGTVPADLREEEERLLSEFYAVGGGANLIDANYINSNISGYALSLLVEQDYTRLSVTTESIRSAIKEIAKQILRLYRAYGKGPKILSISGENSEGEVLDFLSSSLGADDVIAEPDSEMVETPATRRNMVLDLLKLGLLGDENGNLGNRNRAKVLEMLGFGNWESARSADEIHLKKARVEQEILIAKKPVDADENDDHALHIEEHSLFLASRFRDLPAAWKNRLEDHIRMHKRLRRITTQSEEI